MSINQRTDKQNVVCSYNGMLFGKKEEMKHSYNLYSIDRLQKVDTKWKNPNTNHILYDYLYGNVQKMQIYGNRK